MPLPHRLSALPSYSSLFFRRCCKTSSKCSAYVMFLCLISSLRVCVRTWLQCTHSQHCSGFLVSEDQCRHSAVLVFDTPSFNPSPSTSCAARQRCLCSVCTSAWSKIEPFPHFCAHPSPHPLLTLSFFFFFFFLLSYPPQGRSRRVIAQFRLVPHASQTTMNRQLVVFQTIRCTCL